MKKLLFLALVAASCHQKHEQINPQQLPADTASWKIPYRVYNRPLPRTANGTKRILVGKQGDNGTMITGGVSEGDTLVIRASMNPWSYIYLGNLKGTVEKPIVVINEGGQVQTSAGFNLQNCEHIKITGTGGGLQRGFLINQHVKSDVDGGGPILSIEGKSSHIEFDHFVGDSAQYGIWMKNEHFTDSTLSSWVLDGLDVHDFEMKHLRQHGSYIAATEIENKSRPVVINGKNYYFNPSRVGNVKIHDGWIHNVGKNGLMVSDARVGESEIYNMVIDSTGNQMQQDQGTGIAVGGASVMKVHDNKVSNTWLWGIAVFGGKISVRNNTVTRSGYNAASNTELGWAECIRSTVDPNTPYPATIDISGNSVSKPGKGSKAIAIYKGNYASSGNKLCNNDGAGEVLNEGVVFDSCTDTPTPPPPAPKPKEVFKTGYFVLNGKRFYYTMYTDSTWKNLK